MRWPLALLILLGTIQEAAALKAANAQDYQDIMAAISNVTLAEEYIGRHEASLADPRSDKVDLREKIALLREKQKIAGEQAIWLTIRAYDIIPFADNLPFLDEGYSVLRSPEKGKRMIWMPIFESNGQKQLQDQFGQPAGNRQIDSTKAGNTSSDGVSRFFPGAFEDPVRLASFILHEQIHFNQNITPGKADVKTTAELEVEAYEMELRLANHPDNLLGYTAEQRAHQIQNLVKILDGTQGQEGKRTLALRERAAVNKTKHRLPLPERSIVSNSEEEIARLTQAAKDQILIVQRDHDDRLKNQWIELAQRTCLAPGSVRQRELDLLPQLHKREPYDAVKLLSGSCYDRVYWNLYHGATADEINRIATPLVAPNPHQRLVPRPVEAIASVTFGQILNNIAGIADTACKYRGHIPPVRDFYVPSRSYALMPGDDEAAAALKARLGRCEGHVFGRIYNALREGRGADITEQWMVAAVASVPAAPPPPPAPGYVTPPQGTNPCQVGDDPFACQGKHPKL